MSDAHAAVREPWTELSCEYLYYHAVQRSGRDPHDGVALDDICESMDKDGQPEEAIWPYLDVLPKNLKHWKPPGITNPIYKRKCKKLAATFDKLIALTDSGRPSVLVMTISIAFYSPTSDHAVDSTETSDPSLKHAVVIAGTGKRSGSRFLLARSSWGEDWADQGYAWLSERYVTPRILHVIDLSEAA